MDPFQLSPARMSILIVKKIKYKPVNNIENNRINPIAEIKHAAKPKASISNQDQLATLKIFTLFFSEFSSKI